MKLILVRHSKTKQDRDLAPNLWGLSDEGKAAAETLAENSIWKSVDVIYSSNQLKALETALPIAKINNLPIEVKNGLTEITSFTIKTFDGDYSKYVRDFYTNETTSYFGGETLMQGLQRFNSALQSIVEENKNKNIAIISHNNILTAFLKQFSTLDYLTIHDNMPMPSYAVFNWESKILEKDFTND